MKRLLICLLVCSQVAQAQNNNAWFTAQVEPTVFSITRVMMHDVVNPPAATRFYAYSLISAYEIVSQNDPTVAALPAFIKSYTSKPISKDKTEYDYKVAALYSILETGRLLLPSGFMLEEDQQKLLASFSKQKISKTIIDNSVAVAKEVSANIIAWTRGDGYGKLSAQLHYTPVKGDGYWYPTPPAYMEAVEPNWKTIRPLVIDSCNEFMPAPPTAFSKDSSSQFYQLAKEVYDVTKKLDKEQLHIASFWDCNPFVVSTSGHMAIGFKKISPGGHWMSIASIASAKAKLNFSNTIVAQALTGITLMDAFISCWDEKFRSNRIRPETYINRYIDPKWVPLLQTPPFPEYTSGHSVISTAAAEMLTYLFGDKFAYTDNTERLFDIEDRKFTSFHQAASEAAISRLYGGIHYRDAIENGQDEGMRLAKKIIGKVEQAGVKRLWAGK